MNRFSTPFVFFFKKLNNTLKKSLQFIMRFHSYHPMFICLLRDSSRNENRKKKVSIGLRTIMRAFSFLMQVATCLIRYSLILTCLVAILLSVLWRIQFAALRMHDLIEEELKMFVLQHNCTLADLWSGKCPSSEDE